MQNCSGAVKPLTRNLSKQHCYFNWTFNATVRSRETHCESLVYIVVFSAMPMSADFTISFLGTLDKELSLNEQYMLHAGCISADITISTTNWNFLQLTLSCHSKKGLIDTITNDSMSFMCSNRPCQRARMHNSSAKWSAALINLPNYTCGFPACTCQSVCNKVALN